MIVVRLFPTFFYVFSLVFPNASAQDGVTQGKVRLWGANSGRFIKSISEKYMGDIYSILFSLNDSIILVGTWGSTHIWNIKTD